MSAVVVLRSGIIGLSTAVSIAKQHERNLAITIIESTPEPFPGASRTATGIVSTRDGMSPSRSLLMKGLLRYCYDLHGRMVDEHGGSLNWGYCRTTGQQNRIRSGIGDGSGSNKTSSFPEWLDVDENWDDQLIPPGDQIQVNPEKLCAFLLEECSRLGVNIRLSTLPIKVVTGECGLCGLEVQRGGATPAVYKMIPCDRLVIAAGSWSKGVFEKLFPESKGQVPMFSQTWNSVLIKAPAVIMNKTCSYVLMDDSVGYSLQFSKRIDGNIHVGWYKPIIEDPPPLATDIEVESEKIRDMKRLAGLYVRGKPHSFIREVRCYVGRTNTELPILMPFATSALFPSQFPEKEKKMEDRLFLVSGHGNFGISLPLGSGKLATQLVLGETPDIDLSNFQVDI